MSEETKEIAASEERVIYKVAKSTSHKKAASGIHHLFGNVGKVVELHAIGVLPVSQAVKTLIEVKRLIFAETYKIVMDVGYTTKMINDKEISVTVFTLTKV